MKVTGITKRSSGSRLAHVFFFLSLPVQMAPEAVCARVPPPAAPPFDAFSC